MYASPAEVERAGQDAQRAKPFYLCEYVHTMNNSMGAIGDYNDIIDRYPALMGGRHLGVARPDPLERARDKTRPPFQAYGGDWGDFPNDGLFIMKGVVFADRTPKPCYAEAKHAYQWVGMTAGDLAAGQIKVFNKYQFINLGQFNIVWSVTEDGLVIQRGEAAPLNLPPLTAGSLTGRLQAARPQARRGVSAQGRLLAGQRRTLGQERLSRGRGAIRSGNGD